MKQVKWIVLLALFFIVLTEQLSWVNVTAGLAVGAFVAMINQSQKISLHSLNLKTLPLWLWFVLVLFREVVLSNVQVARIVLSHQMPIAPKVIGYKSRLEDPFLLSVYANAITLTPGTMTVDIDHNQFQIHCLSDRYAEGLQDSDVEGILLRIQEASL